jgi:hypothetical protein
MFYDDNIVEGYMLNSQAVKVSEEPHLIRLSFQLYLTNYRNVSFVGSPHFPIRASVVLPSGVQLTSGRAGADLVDSYRGAALEVAKGDSAAAEGLQLADIINEGGIGQKSRLSSFLRSVPASYAIPPDVQAVLNSLAETPFGITLQELALRTGKPIRGLIAENIDEYVGQSGQAYFGFEPGSEAIPTAMAPSIRSQLEVEDLFRAAIDFLSCYGADVNNPRALDGLGLSPRIDPTRGATYYPLVNEGFGYGLGGEVFASAGLSQDPLGAIYGGDRSSTRRKDIRFTQGAGDSRYGYYSDFTNGPGFGYAGFGLYGGPGFGSGQGAGGDPGFLQPSNFTFAGVADDRDAFVRFLRPRRDESRFGSGIGLGASTTGLTGSASFRVGGLPSAFALISVSGEFDITGSSRVDPFNVSARMQDQALGFNMNNPFGAECARPALGAGHTTSTGGFGISDGTSFSWP